MFKLITYKSYNSKTDKFIYELEDTDFGVIKVGVEVEVEVEVEVGLRDAVAIAREYSKRNLDVGKNLALHIMWCCEQYGYTIDWVCEWQDQ